MLTYINDLGIIIKWFYIHIYIGSIVDSGTTDTYLPREIADSFMNTFRKISGI